MKILVFEYITGGGLAGQVLPKTLANEGRMMLQALLDDLKSLSNLEILLPLDRRCLDLLVPDGTKVIPVAMNADIDQVLSEWIAEADLVWPLAPESDGVLENLARRVIAAGKTLLLSDPETVALCADKLATYRCLIANSLPVVQTLPLADLTEAPFLPCVIKPIDGVGCEGSRIIDNPLQFQAIVGSLQGYLIQPLLIGQAVSLSCLFKQGKGWLLCCNEQKIGMRDNQFSLQACLVNAPNERRPFYQALIDRVAEAMPGLWGYIGIDLVETKDLGPLILEINPRLTTSYVGIRQASGINLAEQVLRILVREPDLTFSIDTLVTVAIH